MITAIRVKLRYKVEQAQFFRKSRFGKKIDEWRYLYDKRSNTFPTGLLNQVIETFEEFGCQYQLNDKRKNYPILNPIPLKEKQLRDYQLDAKAEAIKNQSGVLHVATGGGKTLIFISLIGEYNGYKTLILVRRQLLLLQTIKEIKENLGIEVGQIGCGIIDPKEVTVAMIPTLARAVDEKFKFVKSDDDEEDDNTKISENNRQIIKLFLNQVQILHADECHSIATESVQVILKEMTNTRIKLGYSATISREDGKDILLNASIGPTIYHLSASELIDKKMLVPPHIYFCKSPEPDMPQNAQSSNYHEIYSKYITNNEERNELVFKHARDAYQRFEKVLILVQSIEHGKLLLKKFEQEGIWATYISGSSTLLQRSDALAEFENKTRSVLISSSVLNEGVNVPCLTVLINAAGGKSGIALYQKVGRALRLFEDKKRAIIVDFLDSGIRFLEKHAKRRISLLKEEPRYKIIIQGKQK